MADAKFDEYGDKILNEAGGVTFDCPSCGQTQISRSRKAKVLGKEYTCPKCGFVGP